MSYKPDRPYVYKSGKRIGQSPDVLMFQNYQFLAWHLNELNKKAKHGKNQMHQHLEWLIQRGEDRTTKMLCPHCQRNAVKYFSIVRSYKDSISVGSLYTCCEEKNCRDTVASYTAGKIYELHCFRFSILNSRHLNYDYEREEVISIFRQAFGLPKRITKKVAFDFFNS